MSEKKQKFEVYQLSMVAGDCGWIENERFYLGTVEIEPAIGSELDDVDVLNAMKNFRYRDYAGREISALTTTDRRTVYAEDYYGDGCWWEVGTVKNRLPVYGLKAKEDAA